MATRDPDDLVAGRYRLVESDGDDAVVRIWRAHDVLLDRAVVAKEVSGRRQQGLHEARLLARYNRVLDVVEEPGRVWIITSAGEVPPQAIGVARVVPPPAAVEPAAVRRRPRALIVATATLAVAAAGGGIALAAALGNGGGTTASRRPPSTPSLSGPAATSRSGPAASAPGSAPAAFTPC